MTKRTAPVRPADLEISRAILQRWHEDVPNDRLAHLVKDAMRAFHRSLQMRLAAHGIPFGYWTFLRVLWERDGITQRELAGLAGVSEPAALSALRAMESTGHIARERRNGNRKNVYVVLTPRGRSLKRRLVPLAVAVNAIATGGVPAADVAATRRTLLAILENLARDEAAMAAAGGRGGAAGRAGGAPAKAGRRTAPGGRPVKKARHSARHAGRRAAGSRA